MRYRQWLALLMLCAVTLGAGYLLGEHASSAASKAGGTIQANVNPALVRRSAPMATPLAPQTVAATAQLRPDPLPPVGTPLKDIYSELKTRAKAGDGTAASRLYRDLSRCSQASKSTWATVDSAQSLLAEPTNDWTFEQLNVYQARLGSVQDQLAASEQIQAMCAGTTEHMLDDLTPAMLLAAQLGDGDARDCYVHRGPNADPRSMIENPDALTQYKQATPALINSAIAAGDWKMVDMLQYAYGPQGRNLVAGLLGTDSEQHYRYLKLFRLGADVPMTEQLDQTLDIAATQLTADQLANADRWAEETFQRNFRSSSTAAAPHGWDACAITDY
jgi:hypothetical protein